MELLDSRIVRGMGRCDSDKGERKKICKAEEKPTKRKKEIYTCGGYCD